MIVQKKTTSENQLFWILAIGLVIVTIIAYFPALHNDFVNFDDPDYVTHNEWVKKGLTGPGFQQAFQIGYASNWHPLTWLSHMLDVSIFGLNPMGHHLTSILFHSTNTLLLLFFIRQLTGQLWQSAFVAALFALHPLHVESVAWVSERKDVLSTFFGLLTLMAYRKYVLSFASKAADSRQPNIWNFESKSWYIATILLFAFGLMSKPMLVTWPILMLLLDWWPFRRIDLTNWTTTARRVWQLTLEKIPFIALATISCLVTFWAQRAGGAVAELRSLSLSLRVANALSSYLNYIIKMFWPLDLTAYYPLPATPPTGWAITATLAGIVISLIVWKQSRTKPYLIVGWCWYLITLIPVIGILQVGSQARADRYTYVPLIGIFMILVLGANEVLHHRKWKPVFFISTGSIILAILAVLTWKQCRYWRDSETLHRHTLSLTQNNPVTHLNLGSALIAKGKMGEAAEQFAQAAQLRPDYAEAFSNLGFTQAALGQNALAAANYQTALKLKPNAKTYFLLGNLQYTHGKASEAIRAYREALRLDPNHVAALNDLAWILATTTDDSIRNGPEAVQLGERANLLTHQTEPMFLGTLAAAYAEAGRFADAINTGTKAQTLAASRGFNDLATRNRELIQKYRAGERHREAPPTLPLE